LEITEEMEKNPTEKPIDIDKCLGLVPSMLNSTVTKKREMQEQINKCRKSCTKRKVGREPTFCELESIPLVWYLEVGASCIPVGALLSET
jgi:hypothetical protein